MRAPVATPCARTWLWTTTEQFSLSYPLTQLGEATEIPTSDILTRVSISRNSRREMIHIFLPRLREANFHVSFSSRFSRIRWKVSLSPLDFQDLKKISLSPLDFQDFLDQFLFLLSNFKILEKISLSPLDFQYFLNEHFENWSLRMICQNMLVSL